MRSAQSAYGRVWSIRSCKYPVLLIDIMSGSSVPSLVLSLNMQNWDLLPPLAEYMSADLSRRLSSAEIPASTDDPSESVPHIVDDRLGRAWPCSPGFLQYHMMYPEDNWQLIRESCSITWIAGRACNMVDRESLRGPIA